MPKSVDVTKLNLQRLRAYRKSILDKLMGYEICAICGDLACDHAKESNKTNILYQFYVSERQKINEELRKRKNA